MGVSEEIRQKLLPRFRETTADRVEKISAALLELERGAATPDLMQELARELHTLKGEARMMGFVGISTVAHAAEDLLKVLAPQSPGERLQALLEACDEIVPLLDAPVDGGEAAARLTESLRALVGAAPAASNPSATAIATPAATGEHEVVHPERSLGAAKPAPSPEARLELRGDKPAASIRVDVDRLDEIAALAGDVLVEGERSIRRARDLNGLFARWARLSD
ncbi:MAG TPA: Hpt domain-containing protein, partial [Anaeromyxobacter sp.]|nr:Hpt domain-containing protein [Anaeromyxobacter sp.]